MKPALHGAHILVTRPAHQADKLCRLIEQSGGVPVSFPTLEIVGLDSEFTGSDSAQNSGPSQLPRLTDYQWLIFTSANAVNFAMKANGGKIAEFTQVQIAAIGKATQNALNAAGIPVALTPGRGMDSESLLAEPLMQAVNVIGAKILIVKGQGGRDELAKVLHERGCRVDFWEVYKRVMPDTDCSGLKRLLDRDKLDAIVITSSESLRNLVSMAGENDNNNLVKIPLIVISNRIKQFAAELGFARIKVAESPADEAILEAAIAEYNGE